MTKDQEQQLIKAVQDLNECVDSMFQLLDIAITDKLKPQGGLENDTSNS